MYKMYKKKNLNALGTLLSTNLETNRATAGRLGGGFVGTKVEDLGKEVEGFEMKGKRTL